MNKFVCFMAVGLAFTFLQVATVGAQDTAAGLVTGGANALADCGGVPCPTGDDAHTGGAQDCANLKEADGSAASPDAVAICWEGQSSHADGAHAGMAPGTTATGMAPGTTATGMAPGTVRMCGDVPCATDGGGDALGGQGGEDCAILANADLVRECVARRTSGGEDRDSEADQRDQENRDRDRERTEREESR
jgi:hypothetical protein